MIDKSKIGDLKIRFEADADKTKSETIDLKVTYSPELIELVKQCIVQEETLEMEYNTGQIYEKTLRYKVKGWIMSNLNGYRDSFFVKELIDTGSFVFKFHSGSRVEDFIKGQRSNLGTIIREVYRHSKINVVVSYKLEK